MLLMFLPNLGMGGGEAAAVVAGAALPVRRKYTLPDGRRIEATQDEIRQILAQYVSEPEKVELPPEVVAITEAREEFTDPAPPSMMAPLMELAGEVGPQIVMETTDDLSREEAIALGKMIEEMEDDEAVVALLLLN